MDWTTFAMATIASKVSSHNESVYRQILMRHQIRRALRTPDTTPESEHRMNGFVYDTSFILPIHQQTSNALLDLLSALCYLQSTVAQDRIFSLYSIFHAFNMAIPEPNYAKSLVEVFEGAVLAYIHGRKKLDLLAITLPFDKISGFPSWVPKWLGWALTNPSSRCDTSGVLPVKSSIYKYSATEQSQSVVMDISEPGHLNFVPGKLGIKGSLMGRIQKRISRPFIGDGTVYGNTESIQFLQTCVEWCRMVNAMQRYPTPNRTAISALQRILTCHAGPLTFGERPLYLIQELWYTLMLYDVQDHSTINQNIRKAAQIVEGDDFTSFETIQKVIENGATAEKDSPLEMAFSFQRHVNSLANYALFLLDSGYLGMTFHTCEEGDDLVLLPGLNFPMVLRQCHNNEFRLAAPALCDGMMFGECWGKDVDEADLDQIILI